MPKATRDKFPEAMMDAANNPEVKAATMKIGLEAPAQTPEQLADYLNKFHDDMARLGKEANVKLD